MPPKQDESGLDQNVLTLVYLLATATDVTFDNKAMAAKLGIAQHKNVPRKINSIILPYGYELKAGKIVEKEGNLENGKSKKPTPEAIEDEDDGKLSKNLPKAPQVKARKNVEKTPNRKKRKFQEAGGDEGVVKADESAEERVGDEDA